MALSWAAYYFRRGFDVVAADPTRETADDLRQAVDSLLGTVLSPDRPGATRGSLRLTSDPDEALLRADFIQECTAGTTSSKSDLLAEIDKCTRPDSIIASDANPDIMNAVQGNLHFGDRCIISLSPDLPHLNPFTFIVNSPRTSPLATRQAIKFYSRTGRLPIYLRGLANENFTRGLLGLFREEAARLRELEIISEHDLHDFGSWAPSLCCSALVSAIHAGPTSEKPVLHNSRKPVAATIERSDNRLPTCDSSAAGIKVSASAACVS